MSDLTTAVEAVKAGQPAKALRVLLKAWKTEKTPAASEAS